MEYSLDQKQVSLSVLGKSSNFRIIHPVLSLTYVTMLPMSGLILETSSEKSLIALVQDDLPIAIARLSGGPSLSKNLALEIKNLLGDHTFRPQYVAVGTGPGSYTGIRVGAAFAKMFAFGSQIPLYGFCSLEAFAPKKATLPFAIVVDARMGGFYVLKNGQTSLVPLSDATSVLEPIPLLASPHPQIIQKKLSLISDWVETSPDPECLAALAYRLFSNNLSTPLTLSYLSSLE